MYSATRTINSHSSLSAKRACTHYQATHTPLSMFTHTATFLACHAIQLLSRIDIREEIDRKSQALNTRMRVLQFTYLRSPINNLSHVIKNVGFM